MPRPDRLRQRFELGQEARRIEAHGQAIEWTRQSHCRLPKGADHRTADSRFRRVSAEMPGGGSSEISPTGPRRFVAFPKLGPGMIAMRGNPEPAGNDRPVA